MVERVNTFASAISGEIGLKSFKYIASANQFFEPHGLKNYAAISSRCNEHPRLAHNMHASHHQQYLVHPPDELVDVLLPIPQITTLHKVQKLPRPEPTIRIAELQRPQEVARLLEVWSDGVDLVNQVLHTHDAVLAEMRLDDGVVGEWDALLLAGLGISALVDELTDGLEVRIAVCDEGLDDLQHLRGGLGKTDENTIVDLEETEHLEGLTLLGVNLVDTLDADDERELGLSWDVVGAF